MIRTTLSGFKLVDLNASLLNRFHKSVLSTFVFIYLFNLFKKILTWEHSNTYYNSVYFPFCFCSCVVCSKEDDGNELSEQNQGKSTCSHRE